MDFAAAWDAYAIGDYVAVSDGSSMPSVVGGLPWRLWRSHNFVGRLTAKEGVAPARRMQFTLAPAHGATVGYELREETPHSFASSDASAFAEDVFVVM